MEILASYYSVITLAIGFIIILVFGSKLAKRYNGTVIYTLVTTTVFTIFSEIDYYIGNTATTYSYLRTVASCIAYCVRPYTVIGFFLLILCSCPDKVRKKYQRHWLILSVPAFANILIYLPMLFAGWPIRFTENNGFWRVSYIGYSVYAVALFYLALAVIVAIAHRKEYSKSTFGILLYCTGIAGVAILLDSSYGSYHNITNACIICAMLIYCFFHVQAANDDSAEKELEIRKRSEALAMSQIKPHFLYNTLGTIEVLCQEDPELAAKTVNTFAKYLRNNMSFINNTDLITFDRELEYTSEYVSIEELRFDNIDVQFEIDATDFDIPPLSLQTLTENTIRHGVRSRDHGIVRLLSRAAEREEAEELAKAHGEKLNSSTKRWFVVQVIDNGIGFDVENLKHQEGVHIGINNVRERIISMMQGNVLIDSVIDEGTTITMLIPGRKSVLEDMEK